MKAYCFASSTVVLTIAK